MDDRRRHPRVLLIMRDAPDGDANKGGLFPTAIKHHVDLGYDVHVASFDRITRRHADFIRSLGAHVGVPPLGLSHFFTKRGVSSALRRKDILRPDLRSKKYVEWVRRNIAPDVVTGLQGYKAGFVANHIAKGLGVPFVVWVHEGGFETSGFSVSDDVMSKMFSEASAILAVSSALGDAIARRFPIAAGRVEKLPNPIPEGYVQPPSSPIPDWLKRTDNSAFLFASWTTWRGVKRLDVLFDAFSKLRRQGYDARLIVAGNIRDEYTALVEGFRSGDRSVSDFVTFPGRVDRSTIRHMAEAVDCCVISSHFETFGLPMVEALSVGTPVVSTRCGGPEEYLGDSRLGILCERNDSDALCEAMKDMMDNYEAYRPEEISSIISDLLGDVVVKTKWAAVYKGVLLKSHDQALQSQEAIGP
jgi:glycosyltransferase involved in cell wall biosynthesis